jgi:hypothetical protein
MKQFTLILILFFCAIVSYGQRDSLSLSRQGSRAMSIEEPSFNLSIYPVPVRDNSFNIRSDKEISSVKITNIIGQDVFMEKYSTPLTTIKIILENPKRGMYLVVITFADNTRTARRILIETGV